MSVGIGNEAAHNFIFGNTSNVFAVLCIKAILLIWIKNDLKVEIPNLLPFYGVSEVFRKNKKG
jgi:hypothetical protein